MRITLALIAFSVTPVTVFAAQQSDSDKNSAIDYHCDKDQVVKKLCEDMQKRDNDARQKLIAEEAKKLRQSLQHTDETKKVITDVNNMRSADQGAQIDGVTGVAQDVNQRANGGPIYGNTVSQDATDKSISLLDRLGRQENVIMQNVGNAAHSATQTTNSSSSFANQQHQLNESTRGEAGTQQTSLEQRLQQQEQIIASSPRVKAAVTSSESTNSVTSTQSLDRRLQDKEANIMSSATSVKAMAAADRRMEVEAQAQRAEEARQEAAHRAEVTEQARARAEAERVAEYGRKETAAAEEAYEARQEAREEAREARRQQALFNAMYGPPPNQALPYVPSYTPPVSSYGTYLPSYNPSYVPQSGSSGGYLDQGAARPISSPDTFNAFSCMSNLLTESQCLRDHVKPIELSPGCFDDPGTLTLPSCVHGIYGGSSNPPSSTPAPAAAASSTPPPIPAAAPATAPKTAQ
jgi:hypothetical protein